MQSDQDIVSTEYLDSSGDTTSEGYCSRKSSDELQHEQVLENAYNRMKMDSKLGPARDASMSRRYSRMALLQQNGAERSPSQSRWQSANLKRSCMARDKYNVHQTRSNSDINPIRPSVMKSDLIKKTSHS